MAATLRPPGAISRKAEFVIHIFFVLYCLVCILPIALVLIISFTDEGSIMRNGYSFFPESLNLNAYRFVLSDTAAIFRSYSVSGIVTLSGTLFGVLLTAAYAYPLSRNDFAYRKFFAFFIAFTMLFNGGLVPWYILYVKGLVIKNTYLALILPQVVNGFYVIILRTFMQHNIPKEVVESAKLDGAGEFRIFFQIALRLAMPGLATVALFLSLSYWNDWYNALLFIDQKKMFPLQYLMYKVNASIDVLNTSSFVSNTADTVRPSESARMAMAILGIGPIIMIYPFLQRYLVKGLTVGAVKG
ncbi:carbohydrate ABC transporter permease [Cohnella mopanensis]|uniref:carbohydrate ABC transporter permease n=1 Tax=Cohnella mopanensis TaxID=2911966 RepID=UPI001EF92605|nr:carbohydrate ABC transporter permease [Cohnella mopanensis]